MRADREGTDSEELYNTFWSSFETQYWNQGQRRGRMNKPRLEWFIHATLQAELAEEIDLGRLYFEYRRYVFNGTEAAPAKSQLEVLSKYSKHYKELIDHIIQQRLIAVINDSLRYFEEQGYQNLLAKMVEMAAQKENKPGVPGGDGNGSSQKSKVAEKKAEYILARKIKVDFNKALLTNDSDVDQYLQQMREALLKAISEGKQIQI